MSATSTDPLGVLAGIAPDAWLVGGALRDRLLGRRTIDYDVVLEDPQPAARALARAAQGHVFELSGAFGAWRVVSRQRTWQVDLLPLAGRSIEADLAERDLTINAIAQRLSGGEPVDPFGGVDDLEGRRLRMVSSTAFTNDPLRTLRLARLACELGFAVEGETVRTAASSAPGLRSVAPERIFAELKRIIAAPRALEGLALLDELGATQVVLPEVGRLRGVEQSGYHHLDVYDHTRAVLARVIELEHDPEPVLGVQAQNVDAILRQPLADELSRWQALRFGALLHDIAKPQTRQVTAEGRITFIGHDVDGAEVAKGIMRRLRSSERLADYVAALTRHHLRLGFLVHEAPLSRRAVYRYLSSSEPVQVDVTVLSVADRLATRGRGAERAIAKHVELASELLGEAIRWLSDPPRPPVRGDELAGALGMVPGPQLGRILAELEEASFAGEIEDTENAIARARELLER